MARRSAGATVNGRTKLRCSDRFLAGLVEATSVTFLSHVHPDPDSLASMLGLAHLVESCLDKPTRLTQDGPIGRAENRAMVDALKIDLVPVERAEPEEGEVLVMVDSQPNTGRHTCAPEAPLYAVSPPRRLATALLYGIETELSGYPRESSALDDSALIYLYPLADKDRLARIRNARLPQNYFGCLLQALQSSFTYDRLIISWINDLSQPELAAEVVDFLIRCEDIDWAVCAGVWEDQLLLSVRAAIPNAQAGTMLQQVVGDLGKAGGHDRRAGGTIPLASTAPRAVEQVQAELRRRLLKALDIDECRGQRLVPRREMLQNLQA
jgi:nanoRNase/pAp phosphatase (c-di-AMP/oligoRNAs hydrolase)